MLINQICAKALKYQAQFRFFSSRNNTPLALYNAIFDVLRYDKGNSNKKYNTTSIRDNKYLSEGNIYYSHSFRTIVTQMQKYVRKFGPKCASFMLSITIASKCVNMQPRTKINENYFNSILYRLFNKDLGY